MKIDIETTKTSIMSITIAASFLNIQTILFQCSRKATLIQPLHKQAFIVSYT